MDDEGTKCKKVGTMVKRKVTGERHYKRWLITRDEAPHERQAELASPVRRLVTTTSGGKTRWH